VLRMEMRTAEWSTVLNGLNLNVEVIRSRRFRGRLPNYLNSIQARFRNLGN